MNWFKTYDAESAEAALHFARGAIFTVSGRTLKFTACAAFIDEYRSTLLHHRRPGGTRRKPPTSRTSYLLRMFSKTLRRTTLRIVQ